MAQEDPRPAPSGGTDRWLEPGELNVKIVYALYLFSLVVGVTAIVGVVIAYMNRGRATATTQSHYTYQIRTFWIGILYSLISAVLAVIGIGFLLMLAVAVWAIVRCVKGLQAVSRGAPIDNPETWLV